MSTNKRKHNKPANQSRSYVQCLLPSLLVVAVAVAFTTVCWISTHDGKDVEVQEIGWVVSDPYKPQIVPPVRTLHNSASVSSVSAFGTCSPSFTSSIEVCPVAALPVELVSVDTKSNHKLPHVIVLPPSEDVPALLPTETLGNPPVSTAVIPPRFPKLDDGVCIISMSASLQDFSSSGDQGTCFVNPFNDRPPLPDIPVATPEPSDTVAAKPSHLGELQDRFSGFVLGPYWDRVGVVGLVKTISKASPPVPTSNDAAAECDMSAVLVERDAALKRAEAAERELHAERQQRQDLESHQRQMERQQREGQIKVMERFESQRRKTGLARLARRRGERHQSQARRDVAKKRYTRDTWRLYFATRDGKTDLIVYRPPPFGTLRPGPKSSEYTSHDHLRIFGTFIVLALLVRYTDRRANWVKSTILHAMDQELVSSQSPEPSSAPRLSQETPTPPSSQGLSAPHSVHEPSTPRSSRDLPMPRPSQVPSAPRRFIEVILPAVDYERDFLRRRHIHAQYAAARPMHPDTFADGDADDDTTEQDAELEDEDERYRQRGHRGWRGKGKEYPTTQKPYPWEMSATRSRPRY